MLNVKCLSLRAEEKQEAKFREQICEKIRRDFKVRLEC